MNHWTIWLRCQPSHNINGWTSQRMLVWSFGACWTGVDGIDPQQYLPCNCKSESSWLYINLEESLPDADCHWVQNPEPGNPLINPKSTDGLSKSGIPSSHPTMISILGKPSTTWGETTYQKDGYTVDRYVSTHLYDNGHAEMKLNWSCWYFLKRVQNTSRWLASLLWRIMRHLVD